MLSPELRVGFAQDIVLLQAVGINPVVVHGGGPQINQLIERLGLKSSFVRGMRVTDAPTMEAVEMVLQKIGKEIVADISRQGGLRGRPLGQGRQSYCGAQNESRCQRREGPSNRSRCGSRGRGGEDQSCRAWSSVRCGIYFRNCTDRARPRGETYNINADVAAGEMAGALKAEKLILLTDVEGVKDEKGKLIPSLDAARAKKMISSGTIGEGMIPKVECCFKRAECRRGTRSRG